VLGQAVSGSSVGLQMEMPVMLLLRLSADGGCTVANCAACQCFQPLPQLSVPLVAEFSATLAASTATVPPPHWAQCPIAWNHGRSGLGEGWLYYQLNLLSFQHSNPKPNLSGKDFHIGTRLQHVLYHIECLTHLIFNNNNNLTISNVP